MDRIGSALDKISENGCDMALIFKGENIFYLTDFRPSTNAALILAEEPILMVTRMERGYAEDKSAIDVVEFKKIIDIRKKVRGLSPKKILFEPSLSIGRFEKLKNSFDYIVKDIISELRMVKERGEIDNINKALRIAEKSFMEIDIGGFEARVAADLEYHMRLNGSKNFPFNTIVASGARSSNPHAEVSFNEIQTPLLIDWGAVWNGYSSDTTRTIVEKEKEEEILDILLDAQREGIKAIRPGVKASHIDNVVRGVISEYGYGEDFLHSTGHGVGLEVHEAPSISSKEKIRLKKNMVITIEPGIYLKGEFGVRIEDMVLVNKRGKVLNILPSKIERDIKDPC